MDEKHEPEDQCQTPEERERYDAAMRRCQEIEVEIRALPHQDVDFPERFGRLHLELLDLLASISSASDLPGLAAQKAEWIKIAAQLKEASEPPKEPTPAELKMMEFAERLATRQGTHMPDFETLYRKRAELERKLDEPRS